VKLGHAGLELDRELVQEHVLGQDLVEAGRLVLLDLLALHQRLAQLLGRRPAQRLGEPPHPLPERILDPTCGGEIEHADAVLVVWVRAAAIGLIEPPDQQLAAHTADNRQALIGEHLAVGEALPGLLDHGDGTAIELHRI
jgi:hypothetical protein